MAPISILDVQCLNCSETETPVVGFSLKSNKEELSMEVIKNVSNSLYHAAPSGAFIK